MRAFLAIIVDAFREAFASRLLWITLGLIGLLLAVLAPLSYRAVLTTSFSGDDIYSRLQLLKLLGDETAGGPATRRVAAALTSQQRDRIRAAHLGKDQPPGRHEIAEWLSTLLDEPQKWHDGAAWEGMRVSREQQELEAIDQTDRSVDQQRRLARLYLEAALPGAVSARANRSVRLTYGGLDFPRDFPLTPRNFQQIVNAIVLPLIINLMLGWVGMAVAILVTSPIVPHLFHSGSLPLLLSKPLRRVPLYLSFIVGATAFIVVCVTPMVVGITLIVGFRFDIWNPRLLLCIPLFVLLFLVYYSVSAFAALVWRNAIVSVAVTAVFWLVCFIVQFADGIGAGIIEGPQTVARLTTDQSRVFAVTHPGRLMRWDEEGASWKTLMDTSVFEPRWVLGPVALPDRGAVMAQGRPPIGGAGRLMLLAEGADAPEATWQLPTGCFQLDVDRDGSVVAATVSGPYRLEPEEARQLSVESDDAEPLDRFMQWLGAGKKSEAFESLLPKGISLYSPVVQTLTQDGHVLIYSRGELYRIANRVPIAAAPAAHRSFTEDDEELRDAAPKLVVVGNEVLLVRKGHPLTWLDAETLADIAETPWEHADDIRQCVASPDGRACAALTFKGEVYLIHRANHTLDRIWEGHAEAVAWTQTGELLVAHDVDSVDRLAIGDDGGRETLERMRPRLGGWRIAYRYFVHPISLVFPQQSKMGATIQAVVIGEEELVLRDDNQQEIRPTEPHPWRPLVNCVLFTAFMLGVGCLYFHRLDL